METDDEFPVKAGKTMLDILFALLEAEDATVSELTRDLPHSKSTVYKHLTTLQNQGLIVKQNARYSLSLQFLDIAKDVCHQNPAYDIAPKKIDELSEETGETVNLLFEENGLGVHIYRSQAETDIDLPLRPGKTLPLHCTAQGKSILAHMPEERVHRIIDEHGLPSRTPYTISTREELFENLEQIREQEFALDNEENMEGLRCVGAPLRRNNEILGAISISGPKRRIRDERFRNELPEKLLSAINVIELNIGD